MLMARKRIAGPLLLAAIFFAGFVSLGVWQIHRLAWKEALIARVDARVDAAPVAAPGPGAWPGITAKSSEYRHVTVTGRFEQGRTTLVKAVTDYGGGFWVLTPFKDARGFTVLVNRGFVSNRQAGSAPAPGGERSVSGLLRISEPGGGFLRSNQPAADRWFSRDVAAIAQARALGAVAPYFIDAGKQATAPDPTTRPVGGLTVISFPNNHLSYAITWFALAALTAFGAAQLIRGRFSPT